MPSTTSSTIEVALRSTRACTTVPSRIRRVIGSSASERAFQASQSAFTFRHTRLTVSLLIAPPNTAASARRTRRPPTQPHSRIVVERPIRRIDGAAVGAGKIGAGDQRIGPLGSPLVSPQCRAFPLGCLALRSVKPGARHRDLYPAKGPDQRARSVAMPVTRHTARPIRILVLGYRTTAVTPAAQRSLKLGFDHRLDELANPIAQTGLDRVEPVVEKGNCRLRR